MKLVGLRSHLRRIAPGRLPPLTQRILCCLVLLLIPLGAGVSALLVAPPARVSDVGLDGLEVSVALRIGSNSTEIEASVLGGLRSPSPRVLGKHVGLIVHPEASRLTLFDAKGALDPATIDVAGHLFADPQAQRAELNRLKRAVIRYYATVGLGTAYLVAMIEILGYWYLKYRRRAVARLGSGARPAALASDRILIRATATALALVLVLPAGYALSPLSDRRVPIVADPQLSTTFLSGWQLTGPFSYLVHQAVNSVDSLSKSEQHFYDQVSANLDREYAQHYDSISTAGGGKVTRLVVLDDLQGTSGMARTVGEAAQFLHANAIINLGDLTATGTVQEAYLSYLKSYTVGVLAHYAGNIPVFSSLGRHDTPAVRSYAKKEHITVADGSVQKIAGLRMIGANSPYLVNFGDAARLIDPQVTTDTVATGLRETACADQPFAVFAHDKELLDETVTAGCVPLVIGGHDYVGHAPENVNTPNGLVRKVILGSTGGHGAGDGFGGLSTPRNDAPFLVLTIDRQSGQLTADVTTVHPDSTVSISSTRVAPLTDGELDRVN